MHRHVQRPIVRSVVDDDDLELRVVEQQQPAQALGDGGLLPIGGDDQRNRRRRRRAQHGIERRGRPAPAMTEQRDQGNGREQEVERVQREEVAQDEQVEALEEAGE